MNLNTEGMQQYAEFLENNSNNIKEVCATLQEYIQMARQCMDHESGIGASQRMESNIENIIKNVPINDDACKRLVLSLKYVRDAGNVFGGR